MTQAIEQLSSSTFISPFLPLPDSVRIEAETRWDEIKSALDDSGRSLPEGKISGQEIKNVLAFSDFISRNLRKNPDILVTLLKDGNLLKSVDGSAVRRRLAADLDGVMDDNDLGMRLRRFRLREMIRIAWRDISGMASLSETLSTLSDLADACVEQSLEILHGWSCSRYGTPVAGDGAPQKMVVIALGKLGACELNFSSDIDLMFFYPENGEVAGHQKKITNEEFFIGLARRFLTLFGKSSSEGLLFRVDLRLRPFGENGPLVMSFDAAEQYYQSQGREWERYALIKTRVMAGDKDAGEELFRRLKPFIFRRYLDYGVFDSIREMKQGITTEVRRKKLHNNIKLGAGGIREIEFFGQVFQLIRGGVVPSLQNRRILAVLASLVEEHFVPESVCLELAQAYVFLRMTENRIQEYSDSQTHDLPAEENSRNRLALSMGFEDWEGFNRKLMHHTSRVHMHFSKLLESDKTDKSDKNDIVAIWNSPDDTEDSRRILRKAGFQQPGEIIRLLDYLKNSSETRGLSRKGSTRLDRLMPVILEKVGRSQQPDISFRRIIELIKTIERRTCYIALLLENQEALSRLIKLSSESPWIAGFLSRHPVLLDELLDDRTLYHLPDKEELVRELDAKLKRVPEDDLELQMEEMCIFKQVNTLRVAAADIAGEYPLMRVSDHLTDIAETIVDATVEISWRNLVCKYGLPSCAGKPESIYKGFAVIAYGKLGGIELGYGSDLDLVFIHADTEGVTSGSQKTVEDGQFYIRMGERIIHVLRSHTSAGTLYQADMRLRPSGSSGSLVVSSRAFGRYQNENAWTWEHQAIVRARFISGDPRIAREFENLRKAVICRKRDPEKLKREIREMRLRMQKELCRTEKGMFDIKHDTGGIIDIEFLVQFIVLLYAAEKPALAVWTDNVRLLETIATAGIMEGDTARMIKEAYLSYRSEVHKLNMQNRDALVPERTFAAYRDKITKEWERYL